MGKHRQPDRAPRAGARQAVQNAALPLALLLVVGAVALASPAWRNGDPVAGAPTPTGSAPATGATSEAPEARAHKRPGADLAFKAQIVPATTFELRPEPKPKPKPKPKPLIPRSYVQVARTTLLPTEFTVASYNVLGHDHTSRGGNKQGWADGRTRMRWATAQLRGHGVSVAGLQEFQIEQFHTFRAVAGGEYDVYPGAALGNKGVQNSIAWRRADWSRVEAHTIPVPYFNGNRMPMPYVLLEHQRTGRRVWFGNFHNPASTRGPAEGARDAATSMQTALANRLRASTGYPVVYTGDMNEKAEYLCRLAAGAGMHSANGGYASGGRCHTPPNMRIDWILGSADVSFSGYVADRSRFVARTSDHPLVASDALIAPENADEGCKEKDADSPYVYCPPPG